MSITAGTVGGILAVGVIRNRSKKLAKDYLETEHTFKYLQAITACGEAFAHGSNDVANAIGPIAAIIAVSRTGIIGMKVEIPIEILVLGGVGIVVGLATWGYRVIETIGKRITEMTPSRGFSAEYGATMTVLICSRMGLPVSTTHTSVGAVVGIGFARGIAAIDFRVIRNIVLSWLITLPITATLAAISYLIMLAVLQ
jgi:PiT family inorganic phosphate transporter